MPKYVLQVMIRLDLEIVKLVDQLAEKNKTNRSAELAKVINEHFSKIKNETPL